MCYAYQNTPSSWHNLLMLAFTIYLQTYNQCSRVFYELFRLKKHDFLRFFEMVYQPVFGSTYFTLFFSKSKKTWIFTFLAKVNSRSRSLYAIARPSVVCLSVTLVHPTQPVEIFGNFFAIWYLGHPLTLTENFTEIVPGEPLRRGI